MAGLVVGSLEAASLVGLRVLEGRWVLPAALRAERSSTQGMAPSAGSPPAPTGARGPVLPASWPYEVLHPYLGFVHQTRTEAPTGDPLRALGFAADPTPIPHPAAPDDFIVLVFGGSVAQGLEALGGAAPIVERLATLPDAAGKRIHVGTVALGGYKQPQQLVTLAYLLSLGFRPALVLNLDGFNEATLGPRENARRGVVTFFPRSWSLRVQDSPDRERQALLGEAVYLRARREGWAGAFAGPVLRHSATATLAWRLGDERLSGRIARLEAALVEEAPGAEDRLLAPPRPPAQGARRLTEEVAGVWKESSLAMSRLATASGARYLHFLQPNQYVEGSMPLAGADLQRVVGRPSDLDRWVNRVYPALIEAGSDLRGAGVEFHDLTRVFADLAEVPYVDRCCHFDERGYRLLGEAMAEAIATR